MAVTDKYSRAILWLKVALPLVALAILSTLFFVAETLDPEAAIPYAKVDVDRILRDQGITAPTFSGVTSAGAAISLSAGAVRQDTDQTRMIGDQLVATIDLPGGTHIDISSPEGIVDSAAQEATLYGGARFESSTGFVVETDRITSSFAEVRAFSEGEIIATGPGGVLTAGQMELTQGESGENFLLVFKNGVRLIYEPE